VIKVYALNRGEGEVQNSFLNWCERDERYEGRPLGL
jgi:hypothetical protein